MDKAEWIARQKAMGEERKAERQRLKQESMAVELEQKADWFQLRGYINTCPISAISCNRAKNVWDELFPFMAADPRDKN